MVTVPAVRLVTFSREHVEMLEPWFDDSDTQLRLGDRSWIRRAPSLLELTIGDEYRGKMVSGRHMWVSLDESASPVGFVDGETSDRYAAWDASDPNAPVASDIVKAPEGVVWVVDPTRRRQGLATATIAAVTAHADVAHIRLFFADIESDNIASIRTAERAGFHRRSTGPDFEGLICYSLER